MSFNFLIFSGTSNLELSRKISNNLNIKLGKVYISKFSDGETRIEVKENVKKKNIVVIQSISNPANNNIMELILMVDALKRAFASKITAVIPYYGYSRQDRLLKSSKIQVPLSAKVLADLIVSSGIEKILTIDLHAEQIQGFFNVPINVIYSTKLICKDIIKNNYKNIVFVSPDIGGISRVRPLSIILDKDIVIVDKYREAPNKSEVMNIIGKVEGKTCIIVDDIIDTAGTLNLSAKYLKKKGAKKVIAYCIHPVLSGNSFKKIKESYIDELIVSNTINLKKDFKSIKKVRVIDVSHLISNKILDIL